MSIRMVLSRDQWTFFLSLCSQFEEEFNDVILHTYIMDQKCDDRKKFSNYSQSFEAACMSIRMVLSRDQWTFFLPLCSQFEEEFNDVILQIMRLREFRKKP